MEIAHILYVAEEKYANKDYRGAKSDYLRLLNKDIPAEEKEKIYGRLLSCCVKTGDKRAKSFFKKISGNDALISCYFSSVAKIGVPDVLKKRFTF